MSGRVDLNDGDIVISPNGFKYHYAAGIFYVEESGGFWRRETICAKCELPEWYFIGDKGLVHPRGRLPVHERCPVLVLDEEKSQHERENVYQMVVS